MMGTFRVCNNVANHFYQKIKSVDNHRSRPTNANGQRPICVEMMGLIGMGNNPMVGATVACAVAVEEALK